MINTVVKQHISASPDCSGDLKFDEDNSEQRGLVWRERAICNECKFQSEKFSLYEEIRTGNKGRCSATANMGLNIALTQTPISATSAIKMFLGANIPAPSRRGMINCATKVNEIITDANKADMKNRRRQLKTINRYRNLPENEIAVQSDGLYNNSLYSGVGRTPFQPATQCSYIVAENVTNQKQIIAMENVNKLCSKHGFHCQGEEACNIKSAKCTATTTMDTNIGNEQNWAENCFRDLKNDGLEVSYLTTDPDTKAFQAAADLYTKNVSSTLPKYQIDTRHLGENHRRQIKRNDCVLKMMPGCNKSHRQRLRNWFANDISKRCKAELDCAHKSENGHFDRILSRIHKCISAIKKCYCGDHYLCKKHSYVCDGTIKNNWISKSCFLPHSFKINPKENSNEEILLECIEYRLSDSMLELTRLNSNSQKVEATNRSIRRSLPKNVTFTRNFSGRAHSAVHSVNNGPGKSIRDLCSVAGCPIPQGGRVDRRLTSLQLAYRTKKAIEKSVKFILKRKWRREKMFRLYEKHQEQKKYRKAQVLTTLRPKRKARKPKKGASTSRTDHDYHRIPQNNQRVRAKRQISSCPPKHSPALAE